MLRLISTSRDGQSLEYWNNFSYVTENPVEEPEPTCVEGETRQADDGCNDCVCVMGPNGAQWACTEKSCAPTVGASEREGLSMVLGLGLSSVCWQS